MRWCRAFTERPASLSRYLRAFRTRTQAAGTRTRSVCSRIEYEYHFAEYEYDLSQHPKPDVLFRRSVTHVTSPRLHRSAGDGSKLLMTTDSLWLNKAGLRGCSNGRVRDSWGPNFLLAALN
jgi:hypothetical protein